MILEQFAGWQRVPESVRDDRAALDAWAQSLVAIARQLERLGHPELAAALFGDRRDNPRIAWEER